MLRRGITILTTLRRTVSVLLCLLRVTLMTTESSTCYLWLESTVLWRLPLTNVAEKDMLCLHRDQRDPAEFEPGSCFGLNNLGVVASRTDTCCAISLLFHFGGAAEDDWDEEAEVLKFEGKQCRGEKGERGGSASRTIDNAMQ